MKKHLGMIFFILIFALGVSAELCLAATMRYTANFDDGRVATPSTGTMKVFNNFGEYPAPSSEYTFQPGRSGLALTDKTSMYGGSDGNIANSLYWEYYSTWPTDEIYISWWERHQKPYSNGKLNIKLMYLWFDPSGDTGKNRIAWGRRWDTGTQYGALPEHIDKNGTIIDETHWVQLTNMTNGSWHHVEIYINFLGLTAKMWWDGNLISNYTYPASSFNWNRHINWMFLFGPFTAGEPQLYGTFTRQIDDLEIWDGLPSAYRSIPPGDSTLIPRPPVNLNIK